MRKYAKVSKIIQKVHSMFSVAWCHHLKSNNNNNHPKRCLKVMVMADPSYIGHAKSMLRCFITNFLQVCS